LGTKLINEAFNYSINNGYKIMSLDSITDITTKYYSKKGFEIKERPIKKSGDTTKYMVKKLQ
jgi:thiamine pyrophosphokinase